MSLRPPRCTSLARASHYYIVRPCLKKYKNDYQDWVEDSKSTHFSFKGFYVNKSRKTLGLISVFSPAAGGEGAIPHSQEPLPGLEEDIPCAFGL